jgi:hypothetical protein
MTHYYICRKCLRAFTEPGELRNHQIEEYTPECKGKEHVWFAGSDVVEATLEWIELKRVPDV